MHYIYYILTINIKKFPRNDKDSHEDSLMPFSKTKCSCLQRISVKGI